MAKQRSKIWIYFSKISKDKGLCHKCKKSFEAKGGNTSNLISHLRSHHPNIHLEFKNLKSLVQRYGYLYNLHTFSI